MSRSRSLSPWGHRDTSMLIAARLASSPSPSPLGRRSPHHPEDSAGGSPVMTLRRRGSASGGRAISPVLSDLTDNSSSPSPGTPPQSSSNDLNNSNTEQSLQQSASRAEEIRRRKRVLRGHHQQLQLQRQQQQQQRLKESIGRKKRKRRRRPKRQLATTKIFRIFCFSALGSIVLLMAVRSIKSGSWVGIRTRNDRSSGRRPPRKQYLEYQELYEMAYQQQEDDSVDLPTDDDPSSAIRIFASYGPSIRKCDLTILLMDPRLATSSFGEAIWFALESAAMNVPDQSCFVLQTSICALKDTPEMENLSYEQLHAAVAERVHQHSLPIFRKRIDRGQVRISFPDAFKYNMHSCKDFDPNAAFMNANYWRDEFLEMDSQSVLVLQDDSVLCRKLDLDQYRRFAWVGAVWPREASVTFPEPMEGMCRGMPARWKSWMRPQKRWEKQEERLGNGAEIEESKLLSRPDQLLNTTFPDVCNNGLAPVGNGGLSLRNREWLIRAIESCPHDRFSGIDTMGERYGCKVLDSINEDFYFGTVLRAIGAPLPRAWEAALFSTERLWPEDVKELYGTPLDEMKLNSHGLSTVPYEGRQLSIPIGFHKPWYYQPNELLLSDSLDEQCPLLRYIFRKEQSRYQQDKKKNWAGVGY